MKKIVLTVVALFVAAGGFFVQAQLLENDEAGSITITIIDDQQEVYKTTDITFVEDDSLLGVMEDEFTVSCADNNYQPTTCGNAGMMGHVILEIDTISTDWINTYFAIYINDEYSTYGVDDVTLNDGNTYTFEYTEVGEE